MRTPVALLVAISVLFIGCTSESSDTTAPESGRLNTAAKTLSLSELIRTPGAERVASLRLARKVPGFGGAYRDGRDLVVYLTDVSLASEVRTVIREDLDSHGREYLGVRFRPAKYSYTQLLAWLEEVIAGEATDAIVELGVDERQNRAKIGMSDLRAQATITQGAEDRGVPTEALLFVHSTPGVPFAQLTDRNRPLRAGYQVELEWETDFSNAIYTCTYGWNVLFGGQRHMLVSSHCTEPGAGNYEMNADAYQNDVTGNDFFGKERQDPAFEAMPGCPAGERCRYSDAALIQITATGESWDLGSVARTVERAVYPDLEGSLTVSSSTPDLTMSHIASAIFVGDTVDKVGRVAGWTAGEVTSTCSAKKSAGDGLWRLCSGIVSAGAKAGDSGAPVFWKNFSDQYTVVGMLWGGDGISFDEFFYSNWDYIDDELGVTTGDLDPIGN